MKIGNFQIDTGILLISTLAIFTGVSQLLTSFESVILSLFSLLVMTAGIGMIRLQGWARQLFTILAVYYFFYNIWLMTYQSRSATHGLSFEEITFLPASISLAVLEAAFFGISIVYLNNKTIKGLFK